MTKVQEYIEKNYSKFRKSTTQVLDIRNKNLEGELKLEGFNNLKKIICQNNRLTSLDIKSCSKLTKLYCFNNSLEKLYLDGINSTDWEKVQEELKNYLKRKKGIEYYDLKEWREAKTTTQNSREVVSSNSPTSTTLLLNNDESTSAFSLYPASQKSLSTNTETSGENIWQTKLNELEDELNKIKQKLIEEEEIRKHVEEEKLSLQQQIIETQEKLITALNKDSKLFPCRNILLIGRTGNGKSTLANVLTNSSKFKEDASSISVTRETQVEEFEHDKTKYRVIDTVGIGDTKLTESQVLDKIAEVAYIAKEGISRILFVVGRRFTEEEIDTYDKLVKEFKLDENIGSYITIVRTHYPDFNNRLACEKDRESLRNENIKLKRILDSAKIIYVDNDPKSDELREQSHAKLLRHLEKNAQRNYKPLGLEELVEKIGKPMEKKGWLREKINNLSNSKEENDEKELRKKKKEMEEQEEIIRDKTQQYLEKKGINWAKIAELSIGGTTALATIATVVVAVACRIM